jgi:hypothetical protein
MSSWPTYDLNKGNNSLKNKRPLLGRIIKKLKKRLGTSMDINRKYKLERNRLILIDPEHPDFAYAYSRVKKVYLAPLKSDFELLLIFRAIHSRYHQFPSLTPSKFAHNYDNSSASLGARGPVARTHPAPRPSRLRRYAEPNLVVLSGRCKYDLVRADLS